MPRLSVEQAFYSALLIGGFALRIWDVGSRAMHGDEAVHAWMAWHLFTGQGYQYDPVYHGPLQFPVTALFFFLFGVSEVSGRLMAVLFGTALIGLPYFLRHEMGRPAAIVAAFFIAVSPEFVYDSRLERDDIFTVFFAMTLAIALFSYLRTRRTRYVYLGTASITLSLAAMENTYITAFVFATFVLIVVASEFLAGRSSRDFLSWSGSPGRISWTVLGALGALFVAALLLTMAKGLYPPVPIIVGLSLVFLVGRQAFVDALTAREGGQTLPFMSGLRSIRPIVWLNALTIAIALIFAFYSTFGTNLRGIWDASQPFFNTNGICPGNSFPLNPCRKDIIGGLFYWLSQHKVARGGQPWFYYSFLFSLYEQVAVIFGVGGILYFLRRPTIFTTFLTYWAVLTFGVYSWAGEKFPWLMVHALLPFTLIAAMFLVEMCKSARPIAYAALLVVGGLTLLEIHSTYEVNFVNGANPVEMMVYVQSSPDTPRVAHEITTLSNKVTNGNTLNVTVDAEETWPFAWYLRGMPNVAYPSSADMTGKSFVTNPVILVDANNGDQARIAPMLGNRYSARQYHLRWWFPEDYKSLTWSSFGQKTVNPGYWRVMWDWLIDRRAFGPTGSVDFYYYVKKGVASPF